MRLPRLGRPLASLELPSNPPWPWQHGGNDVRGGRSVGSRDGPEVHVGSGNRCDLRIQHDVLEPLLSDPGVAKETLELRRRRADIQERFIHG